MNYDTSIHTNPDAQAWAKFFMQTMKENPSIVLDESLMLSWFANAMMAMHDHLQGGGPINGDHAQHLIDMAQAAPKSLPDNAVAEPRSEAQSASGNLLCGANDDKHT